MKIAVMGAGAIGSYFGGRLVAAGEEVHFIGRGSPHLQAMSEKGLMIISHHGDAYVKKIHTATDPKSVGPVDMILFCVKLWDLDRAAEQIKPMLKADTAVYSFQNGIYAEGRLVELLGPQHVIGGYAATPVTVVEPGVVRQFGEWCTLGFGELDNRRTPRIENFLAVCQRANIDSLIEEDVVAALWMKFIFITTQRRDIFLPFNRGSDPQRSLGASDAHRAGKRGHGDRTRQGHQYRCQQCRARAGTDRRTAARRPGFDVYRPAARQPAGTGMAEWPHGQARRRDRRSDAMPPGGDDVAQPPCRGQWALNTKT
jgi:predicted dinucleotide-binding enzyme